ncbi:MAG TPA: hypothetical protein VLT13_04230 [Bacteroidota bacterium]|nr:hypothetical protein [Bacteroidota bacterium]
MTLATRTTSVEELLEAHPSAAGFLVHHSVVCFVCGEPVWGTLEDALRRSGKQESEIDRFVDLLNAAIGKTA